MPSVYTSRTAVSLLAGVILAILCGTAGAQLLDILTAPKTLVDRAIEARSASDIAKDNQIVIEVNSVMASVGTIKASTEIYEQRLLVTGLFANKEDHDKFKTGVAKVKDVKKLYWHVVYLPEAEQKKQKLLDWSDTLVINTKAQARLIGTKGVADVNFRTATDSFGTVYVLGRARSAEEKQKALEVARAGEGVKKLVDYVEVRP
jgi:osmotically-inducible protein OsmY